MELRISLWRNLIWLCCLIISVERGWQQATKDARDTQDLRQDHLKATHLSLLLPLSPTHHTHGPSTQRYIATTAMLPAYPPSHSYRSSVVALARRHMSPERSWWHCSDTRPPALVCLEGSKHFFFCVEYTVLFLEFKTNWKKTHCQKIHHANFFGLPTISSNTAWLSLAILFNRWTISVIICLLEERNHHGTTVYIYTRK